MFTGRISQSERAWCGGEIRLFSGFSTDRQWMIYEEENRTVQVRNLGWREVAFEVPIPVPQDHGIQIRDGYPVTRKPVEGLCVVVPAHVIRAAVEKTLREMTACAVQNKRFAYGDPRPGYESFASITPTPSSWEADLNVFIQETEKLLEKLSPVPA